MRTQLPDFIRSTHLIQTRDKPIFSKLFESEQRLQTFDDFKTEDENSLNKMNCLGLSVYSLLVLTHHAHPHSCPKQLNWLVSKIEGILKNPNQSYEKFMDEQNCFLFQLQRLLALRHSSIEALPSFTRSLRKSLKTKSIDFLSFSFQFYSRVVQTLIELSSQLNLPLKISFMKIHPYSDIYFTYPISILNQKTRTETNVYLINSNEDHKDQLQQYFEACILSTFKPDTLYLTKSDLEYEQLKNMLVRLVY